MQITYEFTQGRRDIPPRIAVVTPHIVDDERGYVTVLLQLERCPLCKLLMLPAGSTRHNSIFPTWGPCRSEAQAKLAIIVRHGHEPEQTHLVFASEHMADDYHRMCTECVAANRWTFTCQLCHQSRRSSEVKESFGDDKLCIPCYDSVPARKWEDKVDELTREHAHDFC